MERAPLEEPFDENFAFGHRTVYEAALRLLAALGEEPGFPADVDGVEELIGRVASVEHEVLRFAVEIPGELPRFTARHFVWVAPLGDGRLRLRAEGYAFEAAAATVAPDGRLGDFRHERGFGVPEAELTARARADRERVERRVREAEIEAEESERRIDEEQRRFRTERLRGVSAGPWQDPSGTVVAWVAFYEIGFVAALLSPGGRTGGDGPLTATDELGNEYRPVGRGRTEANRPLNHEVVQFMPAVAPGARRLIFRSGSGSVDIEVKG